MLSLLSKQFTKKTSTVKYNKNLTNKAGVFVKWTDSVYFYCLSLEELLKQKAPFTHSLTGSPVIGGRFHSVIFIWNYFAEMKINSFFVIIQT